MTILIRTSFQILNLEITSSRKGHDSETALMPLKGQVTAGVKTGLSSGTVGSTANSTLVSNTTDIAVKIIQMTARQLSRLYLHRSLP